MPALRPLNGPPTVAIGFVNGMLSGIRRTGLDVGQLLDHAGIASTQLANPAARVPVARYAALYRLINDTLDDEGFALFSRPLRRGSFELLCRGALSAATLDEALQRMARHWRVLQDDLDIELTRGGRSAVLVIAETGGLPARVGAAGRVFAHEWLLRMIHGLAAWLTAQPLALDEVAFPFPPPAHVADYELVFAPRHTFDAPHLEARFDAALLDLPLRRDEAALTQFLRDAPASITTLYRRERTLAPRVREQLRAALPDLPSLPDVAARLFLSPRSLHRRLEDEGTGFRAIREALRRDLAIEWLTTRKMPLSRIAADLGFADPAAFYRAFKAWTGRGPRDYRRQPPIA